MISCQSPTLEKKYIAELDFLRAVCAIGIVIFHVSCYTGAETPKILFYYANGNFGALIVNIFLFMSGGVLYHNYAKIDSLRVFYFKRWKAIFPMFYVAWLWQYFGKVIENQNFFYNGSPLRLVFTLFGMDGYFFYRFHNYYILGEWFLGAIILLYVLYPLFLKAVNKFGWKILFVLLPVWICQIEAPFFKIDINRNLIYCSGMFLLGMLCFKYKLYAKKAICIPAAVISAMILFVPIGYNVYLEVLFCVSAFFALFLLGQYVMKVPLLKKLLKGIADISFPIFLVQNVVVTSIVAAFVPTTMAGVIKAIAFAIFLCLIYGWCLKAIVQAIYKTKFFNFLSALVTKESKGEAYGPDYS